eukprot:764850-Hanusia_phi.AAC.1
MSDCQESDSDRTGPGPWPSDPGDHHGRHGHACRRRDCPATDRRTGVPGPGPVPTVRRRVRRVRVTAGLRLSASVLTELNVPFRVLLTVRASEPGHAGHRGVTVQSRSGWTVATRPANMISASGAADSGSRLPPPSLVPGSIGPWHCGSPAARPTSRAAAAAGLAGSETGFA